MSRSYKAPIIKDKNRFSQKQGNKTFRGKTKQFIKMGKFEELPLDKSEVVDDYNVSDWKWFSKDEEDKRK